MPLAAFPDRAALMAEAAERMGDALREGLSARGAACAALSGGSTPVEAYRALAAQALDWGKVAFALVDERCVAPESAGSNEGLLRRTLAPAIAKGAQLLPMFAPGLAPEAAAARADALYAPLGVDVAVMGMGEDGHTASWFAGAAGLADALESTRTVVALHAPQADGATDRLSLTRAALARARRVLLLIAGEEKKARLALARSQPPALAPVAALFDGAGPEPEILWAP